MPGRAVSEIGLILFTFVRSPVFGIGLTVATFHTSGKILVSSETFIVKVSCTIKARKPSFNNLLEISCMPEDL